MVVLKELNNMFWGLTIDGGRRYSQMVDRPFHVSMAALETKPQSPDKASHVQVMLQQGTSQFLLCTLGPGSHLQQQLDLHFSNGEAVEFFLVGKGIVHLTGSLMEEENEFADDYGEDEYDTDSEDAPELMPAGDLDSDDEEDEDWQPGEEPVGSKRKAPDVIRNKGKKMKIIELDGNGDDEEDDENEEYDSSFIDDEALEEEEEEEESTEDEEEKLDSDTLMNILTSKLPKSPKTTPAKKTNALNTSSEASPGSKKKKKKIEESKTGKDQQAEEGVSPAGDATSTKKKKKKKKKKNKQDDGSQPEPSKNGEQSPESPTPKPSPAVGKKRSVAGGTSVEDIKIGHGPEAKPGKLVSVYYSGILAKSNKRFDSCLKGKPFRFRLGRGEVIKGWDTGLIGMKVGGKRKIVVPPSQGYGNARQGPIPPGSTLAFDVEMKAVS